MADAKAKINDAARIFSDSVAQALRDDGAATYIPEPGRELDPVNSLADFIRYQFELEPARHHKVWIRALEDEENYPRLLLICPPGHAKTTVAGIAYPAWKIGHDITKHFIYYGNTSTQATKQSLAIRDIVVSEKYQRIFPQVKRSRSRGWAGDQWYLERPATHDKDGTMLALGVDGPALGARGDEFLFDDVCDPENMASEQLRKKVREKVVAVAFTRQSGKSRKGNRMVAVMTRWHEDDLTSLFEDEGFKMIWMPALGYWEYIQPLGLLKPSEIPELPETALLEDGSPLWPEEYDRDYFQTYIDKHPDVWMLEFQGIATKPGGTLWKAEHFKVWDPELEEAKRQDAMGLRAIFQVWDTASKASKDADFWVCETWGWFSDGHYLLHTYAGHHDFVTGIAKMRQMADRLWMFTTEDGLPIQAKARAIYIEVNGTNNGQACVDTLSAERRPAYPLQAVDSKEERSGQAILALDKQPYYFPAAASAYEGTTRQEFLKQHLQFPLGKHDDIVDVTAWAIKTLSAYPVQTTEQWKERLAMNDQLTSAHVARMPYQTRFGSGSIVRRETRMHASSAYNDDRIPDY